MKITLDKDAFKLLTVKEKMRPMKLVKLSGLSHTTIESMKKGGNVRQETAEAVVKAFGNYDFFDLFIIHD